MRKLWLRAFLLITCLAVLMVTIGGAQASNMADLTTRYVWKRVTNGFDTPSNMSISSLAEFNGYLYAGTINWTLGGSIWRWKTGDANWTQVAAPGTVSKTSNPAITDLIVFNGKLYAGTSWSGLGDPNWRHQVWRSGDGLVWQLVLDNGQYPVNGYTTFAIYNSELYVGASTYYAANVGASILKTDTGDTNDWQAVVTGGNGNIHSFGVTGMREFNGSLYAAVVNDVQGVQVWRYNGTTWLTPVNNGFGEGAANRDAGGFGVFNNKLYLGARNDTEGGKLYSSPDGINWTPVVENGFGTPTNFRGNVKIEGTFVDDGVLYALTYNEKNYLPFRGFEMWGSTDGVNFQLVRAGGFNSIYNTNSLWTSAQVVYGGELYIGTSNKQQTSGNYTNGGELWKRTLATQAMFLPIGRK